MKRRILTYITFSLLLVVGFTSCVKDDFIDEDTRLKDQGTTYLRLFDGPVKATYSLPYKEVRKVKVLEVRRDANDAAHLNTAITFDLTASAQVLAAYNTDNKASLVAMPTSMYTFSAGQSGIAQTSTGYSITLNSGEFVKELYVDIDGSKWTDISVKYAFAYTLGSAAGTKTLSAQGSIVSFFGIQNIYQGTYASVGFFTHPTAASSRDIARDKDLVTINETTCETEFADLGGSGYMMWLRVNADNTVTVIPKGSTPATMQMSGVNKYDPATKSFTLNYLYPGAGGNRVITEVLTLK